MATQKNGGSILHVLPIPLPARGAKHQEGPLRRILPHREKESKRTPVSFTTVDLQPLLLRTTQSSLGEVFTSKIQLMELPRIPITSSLQVRSHYCRRNAACRGPSCCCAPRFLKCHSTLPLSGCHHSATSGSQVIGYIIGAVLLLLCSPTLGPKP